MPRGITLDYTYTLYIADYGNNRVQKYVRNASTGITVAGNGSASSSSNQLTGPSDVAVDVNGNIYVGDLDNNRIQLWNNGATSGITVAGNATGKITNVHIAQNKIDQR
jgi:sugar lactone lactonase YvrE